MGMSEQGHSVGHFHSRVGHRTSWALWLLVDPWARPLPRHGRKLPGHSIIQLSHSATFTCEAMKDAAMSSHNLPSSLPGMY